ncbi:DNA-binding Xre family transcriptional regulator [Paenibacillus sp. V4I3]|uniref:helix-turn-helix domain-containing protein n=1 Tax=unclassified Paenibacillus TaxID=185978 RepID=UPI00277FCE80|nr:MULTISPECIES: helix-turn-helix transcriptional regulator [unclassified Paenibacillus]MDQ0873978.1 DNA-binding Xre family transcriptional regulator [Paenibacillus sp. V4I3]MDQ0890147.1 DNA-binding Xre family transcriptional regulator [Paenibacillus sp. V4I9]
MSVIRSKLKEVMENHDPKLSIRKLAKEINYHFDSVRRMYKDEMVQYPRDLLLKLCLYFNVQPGQLIGIEMDEESDWTIDASMDYQEDVNDKEIDNNRKL